MIISDEKKINDLADGIVSRTHEVYAYDVNIANYQTILSSSDGVYPDHLMALKDLPYDQAMAECPLEDLAELAELRQHLFVSNIIRSEIMERAKANSILNALKSQLLTLISPEDYDTVIAAAVSRRG